MDCLLKHNNKGPDGIFGTMTGKGSTFFCYTLEHAYQDARGLWVPKVAAGTYTCIRHPPNRLPYETFMLENVPAFQGQKVDGILIHILNRDPESHGCIGVGSALGYIGGSPAILDSGETFRRFMLFQANVDQFELTIN